ncbi:MAG: alpha/beta hydrolase [Thermoanaerobaculia bacterium]
MRRAAIFTILAWVCIPGLALAAAGATPAPKLALKPCTLPGLAAEARCGTYEVWENRTAKSGRKIPLRVVVIPAQGPDRLPDPFIYFDGGPGQSSVANAPWVVQDLGALRKRRDILLVDFRGTGGSAGLFCPEMRGNAGRQDFLDNFYPPDRVKACAERLAKTADLSQYTNDTSVDDIDEVRAALGYGKLNIFGASGGSRAALVYLRRHPETVRTLILLGVAPTDERGPFPMARNAQRALDGLIAECAEDQGCHAAFPKLRDEVADVLRQVEKEPVTVALTDGETGKPVEIRLTRSGVAQILRYGLYNSLGASLIPLEVHLAAQGNWTPVAEYARRFARGGTALADGYYFSLTCAEDLPFIREEEIPAAVQGTFLGDFRIRKQQAACAVWPVPPVSREFLSTVTSDVPTLLTSGERDPVTPPANAERAARTLRNSLQVVVPDGGHIYAGIAGAGECVNRLMIQLVETGTVKGLDTSCLARTKRPEFVLRRDPDVEVPADQLARLTGTYKDRESGYTVRVETLGNRLRAVEVGEDSTLVLVATSPTRFRIESMTGTATFQLSEGRSTAVVFEQPGAPSVTLTREGS